MLSCHWPTKVITVPVSDLTLVSTGRYSLDVTDWWQLLHELTDTVDGVSQTLSPLFNNTPPTAGTPRIVEIVNGFTVTFSGGPYVVDIINGNTNLGDPSVKLTDGVSVNTNNVSGYSFIESGTLGAEQDQIIRQILQLMRADENALENVYRKLDETTGEVLLEKNVNRNNGDVTLTRA